MSYAELLPLISWPGWVGIGCAVTNYVAATAWICAFIRTTC